MSKRWFEEGYEPEERGPIGFQTMNNILDHYSEL